VSAEWEYISDKGTTYSIRVLPKWAQRTIRHLLAPKVDEVPEVIAARAALAKARGEATR
jgi:hypothetical protein